MRCLEGLRAQGGSYRRRLSFGLQDSQLLFKHLAGCVRTMVISGFVCVGNDGFALDAACLLNSR
jgi:hypothetical protein